MDKTKDLINRLRDGAHWSLYKEAADEIERLTDELAEADKRHRMMRDANNVQSDELAEVKAENDRFAFRIEQQSKELSALKESAVTTKAYYESVFEDGGKRIAALEAELAETNEAKGLDPTNEEYLAGYKAATEALKAQPAPADKNAERLDAIAGEYFTLEPFSMPTGGDDADVGWRVLRHHCGEIKPRIVAEIYEDDPRKAIDAAIAKEGKS